MMPVMSTSLNVVRMAAVCWAATSVWAIRMRILLILARCSPLASKSMVADAGLAEAVAMLLRLSLAGGGATGLTAGGGGSGSASPS